MHGELFNLGKLAMEELENNQQSHKDVTDWKTGIERLQVIQQFQLSIRKNENKAESVIAARVAFGRKILLFSVFRDCFPEISVFRD